MEFNIGQNKLGEKHPVFIVAEISANHGQDFDMAIEMIRSAKACGADAVKFQTYTPDTMTLDLKTEPFMIYHHKWGGKSLYDLYKKAYTPWEWFPALKEECIKNDIIFFSTAFDVTSVDFLESLDVPVHKIASFELTDISLIKYMAKTGKPLIISTGMANEDEINEAVKAARDAEVKELMLLKCVSSYPTDPKDMNLRSIRALKEHYKCCVGFSDHTLGTTVPIAATTLGVMFIEKHFILDKSKETPDSFFSINPKELKDLVSNVRMIEECLGDEDVVINKQEKDSVNFRRSLFIVEDVRKGEMLTEKNVRSIRPGQGLKPKYYNDVVGKVACQDIKKGTPLDWSLIQKNEHENKN